MRGTTVLLDSEMCHNHDGKLDSNDSGKLVILDSNQELFLSITTYCTTSIHLLH